ncbi:unnamed protein product [Spirodela intermedia]|uniref:Uncharacterized protein n=1 Tax=Spirodela intermedia TaxID=51605 RepID=A0A7I8KJM4_SPIIN|nr:unnamed protein product [Spirodela intermedia]
METAAIRQMEERVLKESQEARVWKEEENLEATAPRESQGVAKRPASMAVISKTRPEEGEKLQEASTPASLVEVSKPAAPEGTQTGAATMRAETAAGSRLPLEAEMTPAEGARQ